MATPSCPSETNKPNSEFTVYSEINLSKLYNNINNNENLFLSHWKMNLLAIVHPYLWFCVAAHNKIMLYKLNIIPSNLKPQPIYDQHQHLLPAPIFSKYNQNPIAYCINESTINHIHSLQHETRPLLFSCTNCGKVSIFDCHSIAIRISYNNLHSHKSTKHSTHFEPCLVIDNTQFLPNAPAQHMDDYSVWSLNATHAINDIQHKYSPDIHSFLLAFGSNTHYMRTFKIDYDQTTCEWSLSALMCCMHNNNVPDVAFAPDNKYIATACIDGMLRVWKNHDYNQHNDDISRIIANEEPVCTYNEFGKWFKSTQCLWNVTWIDYNSICVEQNCDVYDADVDHINDETHTKSAVSKMKKLQQISSKMSSFKNRLKSKRRRHKSDDIKRNNKICESPYINIIDFDPECGLLHDTERKYDDSDDEIMNVNNTVDDYWMLVCNETDLYVMQMKVINYGTMNEKYHMKEALCVRRVYGDINKNYVHEAHVSDRLQFVRYIPEFAMIICASSGYSCVAILVLCKDKAMKLHYKHLGFYPQNWMQLNFECKNCLFIAGIEVIPIQNVNNDDIDFYRIIVLYHSGLISVVNVQSKINAQNDSIPLML